MTPQNITLTAALGIVATVIGIATGWSSLGLPRPALSSDLEPIASEVKDLKAFSLDTRGLILQGERNRYQGEIVDLEAKIKDDPGNVTLQHYRRQLKQTQDDIQRQIEQLSK